VSTPLDCPACAGLGDCYCGSEVIEDAERREASRAQAREEVFRHILGRTATRATDAILSDFDHLAGLLGYVKADEARAAHKAEVRAARLSALSNAADVVHAEARWQWELDSRGHIGAQTVAQRMQVVEACLRAFAGETVADGDTRTESAAQYVSDPPDAVDPATGRPEWNF